MVRGAEPGYFSAIGIPLLRGRVFTSDERLERANVAVISKTAARRSVWGRRPCRKTSHECSGSGTWQIVGVVGDTRWNIAQPPVATLYWPIYGNNYSVATIVFCSPRRGILSAASAEDHQPVRSRSPRLQRHDAGEAIGKSTINSAFDSILVLAFAAIALLLAAAGLYGVLAYLVTQRTTEIGIRIALGARRKQMLRLMLADGLRPALMGLAVGLAASVGIVRFIRSMLYETEPLDPGVFTAVARLCSWSPLSPASFLRGALRVSIQCRHCAPNDTIVKAGASRQH